MGATGASRTSLVVMLAVAAFAVPATAPASFAETPGPSDPCTLLGTMQTGQGSGLSERFLLTLNFCIALQGVFPQRP